jgi:hypothetical protein
MMANAGVSAKRQAQMQRRFFLTIGYLLISPILVYPTLFIVVQDLPSIPNLSLLRYVYFTPHPNEFKSQITGVAFSLAFVSAFAAVFLRPASLQFIGIGTVLMTLAYYPTASLSYLLFDIGTTARPSPLIQGWSYFLAGGIAISVSMKIMRFLVAEENGEPAAGRSTFSTILALLNAFALLGFTLAYPYVTLSLIVLLTEGRTTITRLFEPLEIDFSSFIFQAVAIGSVVSYLGIFSSWFLRSGKLKFALLSSTICYFSFCLWVFGGAALYLKVSTAQMTTGCRLLSSWSSCLSIAHYSWAFAASAVISILTANLLAKYQSDPPLYRF